MTTTPNLANRRVASSGLHHELVRFSATLHLLRQSGSQDGLAYASAIPLMGRLARFGPARLSTLAEEICLDPSTVSRQIDHLVRIGHARRTADPDDGRATLIELTSQGEAELDAHRSAIIGVLESTLSRWESDDIQSLAGLLCRLNDDAAAHLPALIEESRCANVRLDSDA